MKNLSIQWFPRCSAVAILLLVLGVVSLFGQVQFAYYEGRILAELILDGGAPPSSPSASQQAFASFFSNPAEGVVLNGAGYLADGSWNVSGESPAYNDQYGLGPCGTTSPMVQFPFARLSAYEPSQPLSISSTALVLPGHLPNGDYSGQFLLKAGTDQRLDPNNNTMPATPGMIDDFSVPYWVNLRHDLAGGSKHYYAESFRSNPLLPHNQLNGNPYLVENHRTVAAGNPIIEPVGALHVQVFCPSGGTSILNTVSAFITATIDTGITGTPPPMPACDPPYPGWRGAQGTVQASVDMPGGGLLDQTFLVRAGLSYVVKVEFVVYDSLGNVAAAYSAPATAHVPQGDTVDVRIDVDKLFCDIGPGCNSELGLLNLFGANVFMDMVNIPPGVGIRNGPFGTSKAAFIENPLSSPTLDPSGTPYSPANNYRLGNVLPSHAVAPQVWPDTPYTPVAAFYFQTPGGFFERMFMFAEPKMYYCVGWPMQGQQEDFFDMVPGFLSGDIKVCGPAKVGTEKTCIEMITANDLTQSSQANNFWNHPGYSLVGADLPYNNSSAIAVIKEAAPRTSILFEGKYELFLAGTKPVPFSSWNAGVLSLYMDQTFGNSYFNINDRLASGTLNTPLNVYPHGSYQNDHNYCLSEILVKINNLSGQAIAAPQILCQGSYSGSDPLYPVHSLSPNADYSVYGSYWGTPTSPNYTTGPLSVLLCLPKGSYTLTPSIEKQGGGRATFPGIDFPDLGCKERITIEIVLNGDSPVIYANSDWTSQANYTLKGGVQALSGHNLTEVSYTLNGGAKNVAYSGGSGFYNLASIGAIPLNPCNNTIVITAIDDQLNTTISTPITITMDGTPPVLTGCQDIIVPATSGSNAAVVNYNVTALDNCDGPVAVICDHLSGSSFPVGQTVVTCTAKDKCGNTSACQLIVTVTNLCPNLVINGSFESPVGDLDNFTMVPALSGWTTTDSAGRFELWNGSYGGMAASDGAQHLEINANDVDSTVLQTVSNLRTDCPATFSFDYRGRFGLVAGSPNNDFEVSLSGGHTLSATLNPLAGSWFNFSTTFVPVSSTITIAFHGQPHSTDNGPGGAHIDNVSLAQCCTNCVGRPDGLVNWWTFDETVLEPVIAKDSAGSDNHGVTKPANATSPSRVPGMVDNAICFSGDMQWMEVANSAEVSILGDCNLNSSDGESITIDAWIKPDQTTVPVMLIDKRQLATQNGYSLSIESGGFLKVTLNDSTQHSWTGTHAVAANQWNFVAVTLDRCANNLLTLFVNGTVEPFPTPLLGKLSIGGKFYVGRQFPPGNTRPPMFYAGCIDELEFFKRALTVSELDSIRNAGSAGKCKVAPPACLVPVAHYPLDGSVTDVSANLIQPLVFPSLSFPGGQINQGATLLLAPPSASSAIEIPASPLLANPKFTFEAWVRPDGIGVNDDSIGSFIMGKVRNGGFVYATYWRKDGKVSFLPGALGDQIISIHSFPTNCFHHVVGTYDGSKFQLYVNGNLEGTHLSSALLNYSGSFNWTIGGSPSAFWPTFARNWVGVIDDVKIWCRALSAAEVQSEYFAGNPDPFCPCLQDPWVNITATYPGPKLVHIVGPNTPCCGSDFVYHLNYGNNGSVPVTGATIQFIYPTICSIVSITSSGCSTPISTASSLGLETFSLPTLNPGDQCQIAVKVHLSCDVLEVCQNQPTLLAQATILPSPPANWRDCDPSNNVSTHTRRPCCSYDPNDCTVTPKGCGPEGLIHRDQALTYLIQFQNEGSANAEVVVVQDVIDADLDLNTFEALGSSHDYSLQSNGRELLFVFEGIGLTPQTVDEAGSHGFVKFRIRPRTDAPVGTVITNSADIYFDANDSIVTVTTTNTITEETVPIAAFEVAALSGTDPRSFNFTYTGGTANASHSWYFGPDATPMTSTEANPTGVVFGNEGTHLVALETRLGDCIAEPAVQRIPVGRPTLSIERTAAGLRLSWKADGYGLQETADLTTPIRWSGAGATPAAVGGIYQIELSQSIGVRFFRLVALP